MDGNDIPNGRPSETGKLTKHSLKTMKAINKHLKKQDISSTYQITDEIEAMLRDNTKEQIKLMMLHYAVWLRIMSDIVQKKSIPSSVQEIMDLLNMS